MIRPCAAKIQRRNPGGRRKAADLQRLIRKVRIVRMAGSTLSPPGGRMGPGTLDSRARRPGG